MDKKFFELRGSHNPHRWNLPLSAPTCVGPPDGMFMYGGVGLAAAIEALERTCERPVVWATAQYLSFARPPSVLDLDVRVYYKGRHTTQARVSGHVGEAEIITINAVLGSRPDGASHQWAVMPDMPGPDECERVQLWPDHGDNFNRRVELVDAQGRAEARRNAVEGRADGAVGAHGGRVRDDAEHAGDLRRLRALGHRPGARRKEFRRLQPRQHLAYPPRRADALGVLRHFRHRHARGFRARRPATVRGERGIDGDREPVDGGAEAD